MCRIDVLQMLAKRTVYKAFEFVKQHLSTTTKTFLGNEYECNLVLMHSFLSLLSAMLDRLNPKKDDTSSAQYYGSHYLGSPARSMASRASSIASQPNAWSSLISVFSSQNFSTPDMQPGETFSEKEEQMSTNVTNESTTEVTTIAHSSSLLPTSSSCDDVSVASEAEINIFSQDYVLTSVFLFSLCWSLGGYVSFQ